MRMHIFQCIPQPNAKATRWPQQLKKFTREKVFEQCPVPGRWQRIRLGSAIKWTLAGGLCVIAVLLMR